MDVVDLPRTVCLDGLTDVPRLQLRDRATLHRENCSADGAFVAGKVNHERCDVVGVEEVELALRDLRGEERPVPGVASVRRVRAIGAMALTRTAYRASSCAATWVSAAMPAFAAP